MTENKKEFLRKIQFLLLMACAVNPLPLLLYVGLTPALLPFAWAMPLAYLLLALLAFKIPGKFRLLYGIGGCAVLVALGVGLMALLDVHWVSLAAPVLYAGVLMASLPVAGWTADKEIPPFWFYAGSILHVGVFVFKFVITAYNAIILDAIDPGLLTSFFIMVILVMLSLTRINLNASANGRQKPSAFMWQKNLTLTAVFFGLAMLIALVPAIYETLEAFFDWFGSLIKRMIDSIEIQEIINDMGSGESVTPPPDGELPPNPLADILNTLFLIFGYAVLAAMVLPWLPKLYRAIVRFFKKLLSGASNYISDASGDYEDEVTDLRGAVVKAKGPRLSSAEERSLPPKERIRYRYRRLKARHPDWESGSTARENLPAPASPLYEKARYSAHPITEEDADAFKANTRRV